MSGPRYPLPLLSTGLNGKDLGTFIPPHPFSPEFRASSTPTLKSDIVSVPRTLKLTSVEPSTNVPSC